MAGHSAALANGLSVANPGASGWTLALGSSLVPLVAGQLYLSLRLPPSSEAGEPRLTNGAGA